MSRRTLAILLTCVLMTTSTAFAQGSEDLVLVNGVSIFQPGTSGSKCFDLDPGLLKAEAWSPPGRSGESAYLEIAAEGHDPILHTLVANSFAPGASERPIQVQYPIEGGRYCVLLSVTKYLDHSNDDPNAPPNKQIGLRVTWRRG